MATFVVVVAGFAATQIFSPGNLDETFRRGVQAFDREDTATLHESETALRGQPGFEARHALLRGLCSLRAGAPAVAIEEFARAGTTSLTRERALLHSGEALYALGRPAQALAPLLLAQEMNGDNAETHRWLASVYYDLGAMDPALVQLDQVISLSASDFRAARLKGLILNDFERYGEAVTAYELALSRMPAADSGRQEIQLELAECNVKLLKFDAAREVLGKCEKSSVALALLAECHYSTGETDSGASFARAAVESDPDNFSALMILGSIALDARDPQQALQSLEPAARLMPADHLVHLRLSQAYQLLGKQQQSTKEAELGAHFRDLRLKFAKLHEASMSDTGDADLRYELGLTAVELRKPLLARHWLQMALSINPRHQAAAEKLSELSSESQSH